MPLNRLVRVAALKVPIVRRRHDRMRQVTSDLDALWREHARQVDVLTQEVRNLKQSLDHAYAVVEEERALAEKVAEERDEARAECEDWKERISRYSFKNTSRLQVLCTLADPDPVEGYAFSAQLPSHMALGDTNEQPGRSRLQVLEDGLLLGPAHALHSEIASKGRGQYSHWEDRLIFSATDNSDPRTNGHVYHVLLPVSGRSEVVEAPSDRGSRALYEISYFEAQGGHTFSCRLPPGLSQGDTNEDPGGSRLQVLEDGVPLGPAHSLHSDIADLGQGRFSHWGDRLFLSTSDNSDPRINGREYHVWVAHQQVAGPGATTADEDQPATSVLEAERARMKIAEEELAASRLQVYVLRSDFNRSVTRIDKIEGELRDAELRAQTAETIVEAERLRADQAACERDQLAAELQLAQARAQATDGKLKAAEDRAEASERTCMELRLYRAEVDQLKLELAGRDARVLGSISLFSYNLKGVRQLLRTDGSGDDGLRVELRQTYLDLLEAALVGTLYEDRSVAPWTAPDHNPETRKIGRDWPSLAQTMIGTVRMRNIRVVAEQVIEDGIQGDFLEAGVWRGGACIYMRGILAAHADTRRRVFVADSFAGLPEPTPDLYPADLDDKHHTVKELAVPLEDVKRNFARYGLLDDQVVFLKGWFKDTLPSAPIEKLALLRLDGDMYSSTTETLEALYFKVSPGGFIIVDDYVLPACRSAVEDFRARMRIVDEMQEIDGAGVYWRKSV